MTLTSAAARAAHKQRKKPMNINDLIARWNTNEGKPYKGNLINYSTYKLGDLSCMCAQGQVLHLVAGWSPEQLRDTQQGKADLATAKLLNISRAHAVLLRHVNDRADGAPSIVLTDPSKVLGDQWSKLLDFWHYMDALDYAGWQKVPAAKAAARVAAGNAAGNAAWDAAGAAVWAAAKAAAWEIQGASILAAQGRALFFLPMFGFATPDDIPARPANYGEAA